jgi:hypothetical protein
MFLKIICTLLLSYAFSYGKEKQVRFNMDKEKFPYQNLYLVDDFVLYPPQYSITKSGSNLPNGPQFEIISKLCSLLKVNNITEAKQLFINPLNENVEKGLTFIAKQEIISIVSSWKEKGHYIVMVTNESGMDKFLFPIVIQESKSLKIETDAQFLGSFIGAIGNCIGQGMTSKINVSDTKVDNLILNKLQNFKPHLWVPAFLIILIFAILAWYRFFCGRTNVR